MAGEQAVNIDLGPAPEGLVLRPQYVGSQLTQAPEPLLLTPSSQ